MIVSTTGEIVCTPTSTAVPTDGVSQCCTPPPNDQQEAADQREHAQHDHRDRHDRLGLVRVDVVLPAALAEERHDQRAGHVEGGEAGAEQRDDAEDPSRDAPPLSNAASMILSLVKNPVSGGKPMIAR